MSIKKIVAVASILAISVIMFFIYPSTDKSINAGQSSASQNLAALTNVHRISVSSNDVISSLFWKGRCRKNYEATRLCRSSHVLCQTCKRQIWICDCWS